MLFYFSCYLYSLITYRRCQTTSPPPQSDWGVVGTLTFFQIKKTLWKHVNFSSIKPLIFIFFSIFCQGFYETIFCFRGACMRKIQKSKFHSQRGIKNDYTHYRGNTGKNQHFQLQREIKNKSNPQCMAKLVKTQNA